LQVLYNLFSSFLNYIKLLTFIIIQYMYVRHFTTINRICILYYMSIIDFIIPIIDIYYVSI